MPRKKSIDTVISNPAPAENKYIIRSYSAISTMEELTNEINKFCNENDAVFVTWSFNGQPKVLYKLNKNGE